MYVIILKIIILKWVEHTWNYKEQNEPVTVIININVMLQNLKGIQKDVFFSKCLKCEIKCCQSVTNVCFSVYTNVRKSIYARTNLCVHTKTCDY